MANSIRLEIITPTKMYYEGDIELVIVRTTEGDEGFMAGHSWACKILDIGELWIREKGAGRSDFKVAAVAGGFIDVKDSIIIYTDAIEWSEEIDQDRVKEERRNAEEWLRANESTGSPSDIVKARTALAKCEIREQVANGGTRRKN